MKKHFKKLNFLVTLVLLIMVSCSKEDDTNAPVALTGGQALRSQVMNVDLPNATLSENEYQGTLDGVAVTLTKSGNNNLLFLLPYSTTIGLHTLTISALKTTVTYDVKDTVLSETPEATLATFFTNLNTFSQTLDTSPEALLVKNTLDSFNTYYANASIEEKKEMAILYKANKTQFDQVFLDDFSNSNIRTSKTVFFKDAKLAVAKHIRAVALMASGVALITVGSPIAITIGVVMATGGAYKAYKANEEAVDNLFATIGTEVGGFFGTSNKKTTLSDVLTFSDDVSSKVSFNFMQRNIIASDESKTEPLAQEYFKSYNQYNYYANKDNIEIDKLNNDKGTTYSLIPLEVLPTTSPEIKTAVNADTFKNIQFTISHPNLTLVSATLQSDGQLNMKIKITGTPASLPIESFLNYSYGDDFSSFSGKLPIKVNYSLIGTWVAESVNGVPVGQYQNSYFANCPSIASYGLKTNSQTLIISDNLIQSQYVGTDIYFDRYVDSNCQIFYDGPDQVTDLSSNESYPFNGKSFIVDNVEVTISILSNNKIKMGSGEFISIFNRN